MPTSVLHVSASFPRSATDAVAPFLADLADVQSAAGWQVAAVAAHDAGLPGVHRVGGAEVRRARYAPARWEVIVYRGGGHGRLRHPGHTRCCPGYCSRSSSQLPRRSAPGGPTWCTHTGSCRTDWPSRCCRAVCGPARCSRCTAPTSKLASKSPMGRLARWVAHRMDVLLAVSGPLAAPCRGSARPTHRHGRRRSSAVAATDRASTDPRRPAAPAGRRSRLPGEGLRRPGRRAAATRAPLDGTRRS